jgi:hypothetical protein
MDYSPQLKCLMGVLAKTQATGLFGGQVIAIRIVA